MLQGYIRYFRVMLCEKIPVETLCILDPFYGGSGSTLRLADPRRRKALRGGHRAAASLVSRHRLSHCLGHFVRTYGDRRSPDLSLPPSAARSRSLLLFLVQLAFNFCWSLLFFNLQRFGLAFVWLMVLWGLILWMILSFRRTDSLAAWLQVPYFLWVTFAAYLNFGVWLLNR